MSNKRPEPHVAQHIRRDKLRIQNSPQHLEDFPNNLEQLSLHPGFNTDLLQVRSVRNANMLYEPPFYSSETVNPSTASNPLSAMMPQLSSIFPHSSDPASSSIHSSPEQQCEVRDLGNWRNSGSHQGCDWMLNYASSSAANESIPNPHSIFVSEINNELTGVQIQSSPLNNPSGETATRESQGQLGDIIKSASISGQGSEMSSLMQQTGYGIWVENGNQLVYFPNYGNQLSNQLRFGNPSSGTNRMVENSPRCKKSDGSSGPLVSDSNNQALSLSLSSHAQSAPCGSDDPQSRYVVSKDLQYSKSVRSISSPSFVSGDSSKSLQNMVVGVPSSSIGYRNVGPLGPFTGYAIILKSSNFLEPAQQLLDEICIQSSQNLMKQCDFSGGVSGVVGAPTSADAVKATKESGVGAKKGNSVASSSMFHSSNGNENCGDGRAGSSAHLSSRPEYQQRMAKFLYMQEEVIRRYKQHHQQMQMVVSSFESVAGLSSSTPYISKALKSVSRHFRYLENAISDQLKRIREVLGEELAGPTSGSGQHDSNMARLRFLDQSFQKNKFIVGSTGFLEHEQHSWRPQQKGLPERAVAVLRAWLFEHFLHPYPTDADKHMLAARTGLSRNQVSNWFINARVRVWKPMVEEIHMLERKGMASDNDNQNSSRNKETSAIEGASESRVDQPLRSNQLQCLEMGSEDSNMEDVEELNSQWNQEKRSKLECQITSSNMDGTLMGFVPYRRGEVGGIGSVSLTLGLRHGVEGVQQQQFQQQQLRRHFGGQMINDFGG